MEENGVMGKGCILRDFGARERISRISHPSQPRRESICFPSVMVCLDVPRSDPEPAEEYIYGCSYLNYLTQKPNLRIMP